MGGCFSFPVTGVSYRYDNDLDAEESADVREAGSFFENFLRAPIFPALHKWCVKKLGCPDGMDDYTKYLYSKRHFNRYFIFLYVSELSSEEITLDELSFD
jgi:hypothetical protein